MPRIVLTIGGLAAIASCVLANPVIFAMEKAEESDFAFARKSFTGGLYDLAGERLESFLRTYPSTAYIHDAHDLLGRCYYYRNNYPRALYEFETVLSSPSAGKLHDEALYWTAEIHLKMGDYRKALEYYQNLIDNFPSSRYSGYAIYSKGWAYYKLGLLEEALVCFRTVVSGHPYERVASESQFRIGECEYLLGRYSRSEEELAKFIDRFPLSEHMAEAYYLAGESKFHQSKYRDSIVHFEKALLISPQAKWSAFAIYRKASGLFGLGDFQNARSLFSEASNTADNDSLKSSSIIGLARSCEKLGRTDDARASYDIIISKYGASDAAPEAYCGKARIFYSEGKPEEAEALCREAIEKYPKSRHMDKLRYTLAWICLMRGDIDEGLREFERVAKRSGDRTLAAGALAKAGDIYLDIKNYRKAGECYDSLLNKYPDSPWADYAQYQTGCVFLTTGRLDQALLAFRSVLVNFPKTSLKEDVLFKIASAYFKKRDFEHAAEEFHRVMRDFSDGKYSGHAALYLADSLYEMNRPKEALDILRRHGRHYQGDERLRMMSQYLSGLCLYNMHRDAEAAAEFSDFLKKYPDSDLSTDVKFWFGEYYRSRGKFDKAREYFHSILEDGRPDDMVEASVYNLGLTLLDENNTSEAIAHFELLAANYPESVFTKTAYRKMARMKCDNKDFEEAVKYLKKAITGEDCELNAQIQYEIAECFEKAGDLQKALDEYGKVPALYSKGAFWSVKSEVKSALMLEELGRADEAGRIYGKLAVMDIEESRFAKDRLEKIKHGHGK